MGKQLFIADLHLSVDRPAVTGHFLRFLRQQATDTTALYILGDLFDAWIGDDAGDDFSRSIAAALSQFSQTGARLYLQHGNRDFLLGDGFCHSGNALLIEDEHCIDLAGQTALLMHGDLLCSDDHDYQQARKQLRNPAFIADFLSKPVDQRMALAQEYRRRSGEATSLKAMDIMDVNPATVSDYMIRHDAALLIHGHTHRPGIHELGNGRRRIVLGEWSQGGATYLSAGTSGIELLHFS